MVTLLMGIEDEFLIELEEKDMNPYDLTTVQDCIDLVERYVGDSNEKRVELPLLKPLYRHISLSGLMHRGIAEQSDD